MKKIFLVLLLLFSSSFAQYKFGEAKGLFMAIGVGPRFPIYDMSDRQNIGVGFNATFAYTDNNLMPIFFYTSIGYQHFPGSQDLYKRSDYSSFSSNVLAVQPGIRYYFKPMFEQVVLLMPVIDLGAEYNLYESLNQFKTGTGKENYLEDINRFGFHAGLGVSMFLLDFIAYYHYVPENQYISVDLRVNIPIFVKL
jgi:hypothetical protein